MIIIFEWMARVILLGLIGLSLWSVQIMLERRRFFKAKRIPLNELLSLLKSGKKQEFETRIHQVDASFSQTLMELSKISQKDDQDQLFQIFMRQTKNEAQLGLSVLGTLGSTTPFIGLLGTVMGIIVSFGKLSEGGGGTNAVMFSLAEALVLTAVGLMVAIPAVVAFNHYGKKVKLMAEQLMTIKDSYFIYGKKA